VTTIQKFTIGSEPILSLCMGMDERFLYQFEWFRRYLVEINSPSVEVVCAVVKDEPFTRPRTQNAAVGGATTDYLAFVNGGAYPPRSLLRSTRYELDVRPRCVAFALRLDGTRDYGVFPNPFAAGDWLCMRKSTFNELGGHNETMNEAGGTENELIGRAYQQGRELVIFEDRIYHSWHDERKNPEKWQREAKENEEIMARDRVPFLAHWLPEFKMFLPQLGCTELPLPKDRGNQEYWDCIFKDKGRRVGPFEEPTT